MFTFILIMLCNAADPSLYFQAYFALIRLVVINNCIARKLFLRILSIEPRMYFRIQSWMQEWKYKV